MHTSLAMAAERVYRFETISSISHGISSDEITALQVDALGNTWIGTPSGLNRLSDIAVTVFRDQQDGGRLLNSQINALATDGRYLWIGSAAGLQRYDIELDIFESYAPSDNDADGVLGTDVRTLLVSRDGRLWIGSAIGLSVLDVQRERFKHYRYDPEQPSASMRPGSIVDLHEDQAGHIWISTLMSEHAGFPGVTRLNTELEQFQHYRHDAQLENSLPSGVITAIGAMRNGTLLFGSARGGLALLDRVTNQFSRVGTIFSQEQTPLHLDELRIADLFVDAESQIWLATVGDGLICIDLDTKTYRQFISDVTKPDSVAADQVSVLFGDTHAGIYAGTLNRGASRFDPKTTRFNHIRVGGADSGSITRISEMPSGLHHVTTSTGDQLHLSPQQPRNDRVHVDVHPSTCESLLSTPAQCAELGVTKTLTTSSGISWLLTESEGLWMIDTDSSELVQLPFVDLGESLYSTALAGRSPVDILEDDQGSVWVTTEYGLNKIDVPSMQVTRYIHDDLDSYSLPTVELRQLYIDGENTVWISSENGLLAFDPETETFRRYTDTHGLTDNLIQCMLPTDNGLWLATSNGLTRWDMARETAQRFYAADGLQGNEFNQGACHKGQSGVLYFGGTAGYNYFKPENITASITASFPVIKAVHANQARVSFSGNTAIPLTYDQDLLMIDYGSQSPADVEGMQFEVMLDPVDEGWRTMGDSRQVFYTNLSEGAYEFSIRASNRFGVVSDPSTISFYKQVHPLISIWALTLYLAAALLVIYWIYSSNQRKLNMHRKIAEREHAIANDLRHLSNHLQQARETERTAIARELHDDLAQTMVALNLEMAWLDHAVKHNQAQEVAERMPEIKRSFENGVKSLRHVTQGLRPAMLEERGLVPAIEWHVENTTARAGLIGKFETNCADMEIPESLSKNIFRIAQELVNNVIQHAEASELCLSLKLLGERLVLEVSDNGKGLAPGSTEKDGHFGLIGIRERVAAHQGQMTIKNKTPAGALIAVSLPV